MAKFIEARVIQKVATEAEWLQTTLPLYQGEIAFVSDKYNFKLNTQPQAKTFAELDYYYKGDILGGVLPTDDLASKPNGVYRATISGTYGGVVVKEGYYTLLRKKDDGTWVLESETKIPMQDLTPFNNRITQVENDVNDFIENFAVEVDNVLDVNSENAISNKIVTENFNTLLNNGNDDDVITDNQFNLNGFIYAGTSFAKGTLQGTGDSNNKSTDFIFVEKGTQIKCNTSLSNEGYTIAFYSSNNRSSFISGIVGSDNTQSKLYNATAPQDCYVSFSCSSYADADAFETANYTIGGGKIYIPNNSLIKLNLGGSKEVGFKGDSISLTITKDTTLIISNSYQLPLYGKVTKIGVKMNTNETQTSFNAYIFTRNGNTMTILQAIPITLNSSLYGSYQEIDISELNLLSVKNAYLGLDSASYALSVESSSNPKWFVFNKSTLQHTYTESTNKTICVYCIVESNELTSEEDEKVPSLAYVKSLQNNKQNTTDTSDFLMSSDIRLKKKFNYSDATKIGVVLDKSASGFDNGYIESPCIIWDDALNKYVMVYTAYTSTHVASIGWATSEDLVTWVKKGQFATPSGLASNGDQYGMTAPVLIKFRGVYHLFYMGLNGSGYEGEPINMCLATTNDISGSSISWSYKGIKIPIQTDIPWANQAIYHPTVNFINNKWYMFFNARGVVNGYAAERTGFATSNELDRNWVVDPNRISEFTENKFGQMSIMCGDPSLVEYGGLLYMFYFNVQNGAVDHWAWTTRHEFPRGWRYGGQASVKTGSYETTYAHKPFVIKKDNKLYHYYTGVSGSERSIVLQTFNL